MDMQLPRWVSLGLMPLLNVCAAFVISGIIVLIIGEDPLEVVKFLITGAFGYPEAIGYTLFYATNFIFTGLAVAVAFHAGLFNIGGEGQAYIGGLGLSLVCLHLGFLPIAILIPLAILGGALFGGAWAYIPAWLQAKRGSHIVITTIMFNFIAASLMVYLLVNILIKPGQPQPETRVFSESGQLPTMEALFQMIGVDVGSSPLNMAFLIALAMAVMVWFLIWRTSWGFRVRSVGQNAPAAVYAGTRPDRIIIQSMMLSGALAGMLGLNELMGVQHRLLLEFTAGYGFVGIAVALMGRSHPIGIVLASILFGALYQGGAELAFEIPSMSRELVVIIQGLIILFAGALENLFRPFLVRLFTKTAK